MNKFNKKLSRLLIIYLGVVALIFLSLLLVPKYVLTIAAILFLAVPYVFGNGLRLKIDKKSLIFSMTITLILIGTYILLFLLFSGRNIDFSVISFVLIFNHLVVISFPEEAFFRGYLQEELGNDINSIFIVSILFALGHLITICAYSAHLGLHCISAFLTFLPSLVMGFLYYRTKSIWASVIFHFLANIAYISTSGYSVFY